ncbi:P-loop NTPase fold protein [Aliarcobacter skirrowii]|uniref:P-loop NTPase fold protein n=1 Tax=Aliarcobacter skirrowii TaxID=28200 RepID=A0AAW9DAT5_9BACT|nr:P-loop NTPase fold protein [Aliarcobacter skirrowii]MDX4069246.1 P-loop NTPase fold protein [Aliarcobacter skirrowii]
MEEEDFFLEDTIDAIPNDGYLVVEYNNTVLCSVHVHSPDEEILLNPENAYSSTEGFESFLDLDGNKYYISVYPGFNKVRYEIAYDEDINNIINIDKAKEFFKSITVRFINYKDYITQLKFFTIKTSKEKWIKELVNFFEHKNTDDIFQIEGLTQLSNDVEKDNLIFIVAGGDKGKIKFDYVQGLYGVAKVVKVPYNKINKSYTIDVQFIYFFNKVLTRKIFSKYENLFDVPNVGPSTKGEQNQAISGITIEQAKSIMLASAEITKISNNILFSLFPWVKDEYQSIATENYKSLIDTLPPALNVISIAKVFAKYLINYNSKHTTTLIGIFGMWGRGKTYFFDKVKEYILNTNNEEKKFYFCKFQPWKYQRQEATWAYLYQKILESYLEKDIKYLDNSFIKKILNYQGKLAEKSKRIQWLYKIITSINIERNYKILALNIKRLGAIKLVFSSMFILMAAIWIFFIPFDQKLNFLSWLIGSIGIVGMIYMYKSYSFYMISRHTAKNIMDMYGKTNDYSNYLGFQSEIEKELSLLLQAYIDEKKEKLVLFIDDLDRCNEKILIDIIDGLKLVLDNEEINSRLLVVTAVDERILEKAIEHKYLNKKLPTNIGTREYIEKFFLMGIKLNQLNNSDIDELVDIYTDKLNYKLDEDDEPIPEIEEPLIEDDLNIDAEISGDIIGEIGSDEVPPVIIQSNDGNVRPLFVNNQLNIESLVLKGEEVQYIKEILKKVGLLTPRKINMFIHRYLIFKSLILEILDDIQYEKFHPKMLVEFVVMSQNEAKLNEFKEYYKNNMDFEIFIPLDEFSTEKINRENYIILIKFAEMVSPF